MEEVKVCRICLATDVKMYNLLIYPLAVCYEVLIGNYVKDIFFIINVNYNKEHKL